ncbi:hypothetical protein [Methylobacterium pseudosasicola]|uniref:hypothetical protein n=1 Tax=Methylobacterium pseudosasicola TaxID=582667 RepID=UPI00111438D3|nr:hypothetical protein [Methylobacterium pseudosasicola]
MTLIVCLRAQGCVVFAADSLTNINGRVENCGTVKVHKLSDEGVVALCGWAGTKKEKWRDVFGKFNPPAPNGGTPASSGSLLAALQATLNGHVSIPDPKMIGACKGGNTVLAATLDPTTGDISIERIGRHNDVRKFDQPMPESPVGQSDYIEFIGDTDSLKAYIAAVRTGYAPGMPEAAAVAYATDAIRNAIPIAQNAGVQSIGGEFIRVVVLSSAGVTETHSSSGVPCP